ncbi:MAG: chromate transporter [Ignavibacteria bacterium]|jgi:chromate transporter|nr:chromate transporter [Ignavibacteria bacterium]MCU7503870.1 chromate transporter [Ignavibacteria bacterium]MCU7515909.1 chromate transporter [Ignavibacteria bacterium]
MINNLFELFVSFFKVGSFSFGGAYSLVPLIEAEVVEKHSWLSHSEFLKVLGMVEVVPGAISVKYATYTGYKVAGVWGVVAANLGNMFMPVALISLAAYFYSQFEKNKYVFKGFEGIKFAVIGMILAIMVRYLFSSFSNWKGVIFIVLGFALTYWLKLHPILIVVGAAIVALLVL